MEIRKLTASHTEEIKIHFRDVFMNPPWNDDWSSEAQLDHYLQDLTGNRNSLTIGLYDGAELAGVSMGHIMHWCAGTEYYIQEFFIVRGRQNRGLGKLFLREIEEYAKQIGINHIFLQTERNLPAYDFYTKAGFTELTGHASLVKMFE